jgi:hypothetical protein
MMKLDDRIMNIMRLNVECGKKRLQRNLSRKNMQQPRREHLTQLVSDAIRCHFCVTSVEHCV